MQSGENVIESCHNCEAVECKIVSNWQYFTFNRFAVMATQPLLPSDYIEGYSYSIAPRLFQHIICILSINLHRCDSLKGIPSERVTPILFLKKHPLSMRPSEVY